MIVIVKKKSDFLCTPNRNKSVYYSIWSMNTGIKFALLIEVVWCSLAGDFGFDPLGLGEDPNSLKWFVQAELVHSRFAMAGAAGILFTDVSRFGPLGQ